MGWWGLWWVVDGVGDSIFWGVVIMMNIVIDNNNITFV